AADLPVVPAGFPVPLRRDEPRKRLLQCAPWQADYVGVGKEGVEEGAGPVETLRAAQGGEKDSNGVLLACLGHAEEGWCANCPCETQARRPRSRHSWRTTGVAAAGSVPPNSALRARTKAPTRRRTPNHASFAAWMKARAFSTGVIGSMPW